MPFRDQRMEGHWPSWGGTVPGAAEAVFGDLMAYLRRPIGAIADEYRQHQGQEDGAAQERVGAARDEAPVLAYYATTPHYLYELSYWEASADKQMWFRVVALACRAHRLRQVLDFGGGVGGLSLCLNGGGIRCDYLDVAGKTFDYAAWRFARHGLAIPMFDAASTDRPPHGPYDAVVAWDVLEHLFDLEGAIRTVHRLLRPGGWFISKSTFATAGGAHEAIHLAQHARYADVACLNELMARCGFRFVGQLKPSRVSRALQRCGARGAVTGIRIARRLKHGGNFLIHER